MRTLTSFFEWIMSGADRELQRTRESRKYFVSWVLSLIILLVYSFLYNQAPLWDDKSSVAIDGMETLLILWGMYFGANSIQKSSVMNSRIYNAKNKTTNNEDYTDPEKIPL